MKKVLNILMFSVIIILIIGMVTHIVVSYMNISNDVYTSASASVAFVLIIPYGIAIAVCLIVWNIIRNRSKTNEKTKSSEKQYK